MPCTKVEGLDIMNEDLCQQVGVLRHNRCLDWIVGPGTDLQLVYHYKLQSHWRAGQRPAHDCNATCCTGLCRINIHEVKYIHGIAVI